MDFIYMVLGFFMIYTTGHYIVVSFKKSYNERTSYEKFVSWAGIISTGLLYLSIMLS